MPEPSITTAGCDCPACGSRTEVLRTVRLRGVVARERRCLKCAARLTTEERATLFAAAGIPTLTTQPIPRIC
jgi:transcriptional regulator NrdR family protein